MATDHKTSGYKRKHYLTPMKEISELEDKLSRRLENICSQTCILGQCGKKNLLHCAPSLSPKAKLWVLEATVCTKNYLWASG
jgi:hypothetical protein